jgi:hypothetical protein
MPCIFCIAVVGALAAQAAGSLADALAERLRTVARGPVDVTADTGSVSRLEAVVEDGDGVRAPVAVTLYKAHDRVRIQVLTHDLDHEAAHKLQNHLAEVCGLTIVDRSTPETEAPVRAATEAASAQTEPARRDRAGRRPVDPRPAPPTR